MTRTSDEPHGVISTWLQSHLSVRVSGVPNHWPGDQYWAMDHLLLGHKDRIKNAFLFLAYRTIDPWFNSVFEPNSIWTGGGTGQLKTPKQTFCSQPVVTGQHPVRSWHLTRDITLTFGVDARRQAQGIPPVGELFPTISPWWGNPVPVTGSRCSELS